MFGGLIAGILLGLQVHRFEEHSPVLEERTENEVFTAITDLGIFFLMPLGGIELHPKELAKPSASASIVALFGMLVPFGLGMGFGWLKLP